MRGLLNSKASISPKISIGIVVYNGIEHIRRALESIIGQSYKNIELIVVDGGSNDGTQHVLSEYAEYISVLICEPDKGIYDAMNKVCAIATGDWLLFLGCDDVLLESLGNISKRMTDPDSVYYGDAIFRSSGNVYGGMFSKRRLAQMNFCHQAMFYPQSVYRKYSYCLDYKWLADYAYNIKLFGLNIPFVYIEEVISVYNDKGESSQGDAEFEKSKVKLVRSSFGFAYAQLEMLRRLRDKTAITIGFVLKRLLPYSYWKYLQSLWRGIRNKY